MIGVILYSFILSGLLVWYYKFYLRSELKPYAVAGFSIKIIGAIALGIFYLMLEEGGDTFRYHHAALIWRDYFFEDPIGYLKSLLFSRESLSRQFIDQPRAVFFTKILSVVEILCFGNYWMSAIFFAIISYCSSWFLFRRLSIQFNSSRLWFIALFFFPSVVFWCSGILKETISFSILAFLSAITIKYYYEEFKINYWELLVSLICVWVLVKLKYYVAGAFIPIMVGVLFIRYIGLKVNHQNFTKFMRYGTIAVVMILFFLIATKINHNLSLSNILDRVVMTHNILIQETAEGFRINFDKLEPTMSSFLKNTPLAIVSGLFRPFFWETNSGLSLIAGIENLILISLVVVTIFRSIRDRISIDTLGIGVIAYVIIMSTFLALATPNFGTLVRFKTSFSPFLLILCFYVIKDWKAISGLPRK
ncbi:MAG: hypothetical protein NXI20_28340 [bacterium]|nr:hypothetical protein [bacterium]